MGKVIVVLSIVDLAIMLLSYFLGGSSTLLNTQVGFITSSLVMLGSMKSYHSMVESRLNVGSIPDDERDTLDKLEDPYDLYDDEKVKEDEEKTLQEVVKEERKNLKKNRRSFLEATKDSKAAFSFYRLGAYILLIFGFFYLNNNKILEIPFYLISLFIPTIVVVLLFIRQK
jgi:uncharacterized integral membrane protein